MIKDTMQRRRSTAAHLPPATDATRRRAGGLLSATTILMVAFLLSRVLGMLRTSLFTGAFGADGPVSAAYITAFRIPDLLFNLVSGGALTSAFLPTFAGLLARGSAQGEEEAWQVASTVFYLTILILAPLLALGMLLAPWYVPWLVPNHDQGLIDQAIPLTRIMLIQPLFMALISLCQGISNAYMRFTAPALAPLVYNMSLIVGIVIGQRAPGLGIKAVAWSVSIGAALQLAVQIPWLPKGRRLLQRTLNLGAHGVREIGQLMLPRLFGQAGVQATFIVTTALANLLPHTPNAAMANGWMLILLPVGIFGASLGTAAFPAMARLAAAGDRAGFAATVSETVRMVFFLTIPATAGLIVLAPQAIRVLFAYGASNNTQAIHLMTVATIFYAVGIPGHALVEVFPRAFYSLKNTRTPVLITIWTLALAILLSTLTARFIAGENEVVAGLALAISVAVLVEAVNLALALHRMEPAFALGLLGWALTRINLAAGAMMLGIGWIAAYLEQMVQSGKMSSLAVLAVCVPIGAMIYLGTAIALRIEEAETAVLWVRRRVRI